MPRPIGVDANKGVSKALRTPTPFACCWKTPSADTLRVSTSICAWVAEDGYEARRSYSITSAPGSSELELLIERLPNGEVSPFIADELQLGEILEIRGPIGRHSTWTPSNRRPIALIAGGSGIAPLMSIVRLRSVAPDPTAPALLLYSARNWRNMAFAGDIEMLKTLLHPRGDRRELACFICGATEFVETAATALVQLGVPADAVKTERYGGP